MSKKIEKIIEHLELIPLPLEGGYYKVTYESKDRLGSQELPERYASSRAISNAIYYLMDADNFSLMHQLMSDEIWHFYAGDPVEHSMIDEEGRVKTVLLGDDVLAGQSPQIFVPLGAWQGARLLEGGEYALLGTTVSPGYDDADFELAEREKLVKQFPNHKDLIIRLTK